MDPSAGAKKLLIYLYTHTGKSNHKVYSDNEKLLLLYFYNGYSLYAVHINYSK